MSTQFSPQAVSELRTQELQALKAMFSLQDLERLSLLFQEPNWPLFLKCLNKSQEALERALFAGTEEAGVDESAPAGPSTQDYVSAIRSTRTTVSPQAAAEFLEDIERLARL